jgi:molybdate transport system substrate-binding protein
MFKRCQVLVRSVSCGLLFGGWLVAGAAHAAELQVLSAGAIEPGLTAAASAFERETGHVLRITFNTAPELRKRRQGQPAFDVVIAPPAVIADFAVAGQLAAARANVGRVGMGVTVRNSAPVPDISSAEALKLSLLDAQSVVFNRASTGLYLEGLLRRMDLEVQVQAKATRYPDGASVLEQVIHGQGREIGFAAMTEILLYQGKGLQLVGPMPAELQNYTAYTAAPLARSSQPVLAQQLVGFLAGPVGKPLFVAAGVTD